VLKVWSNIKFFESTGIEALINARICLTEQIQQEIRKRSDLVLLNETDINSCMFVIVPYRGRISPLSVAGQEKVNNISQSESRSTKKARYIFTTYAKESVAMAYSSWNIQATLCELLAVTLCQQSNMPDRFWIKVQTLGWRILQDTGYKVCRQKFQDFFRGGRPCEHHIRIWSRTKFSIFRYGHHDVCARRFLDGRKSDGA
jgi:hypothetical protein